MKEQIIKSQALRGSVLQQIYAAREVRGQSNDLPRQL
jgi:hypothetical protein